jgi:hypothetical protein
VSSGLVALTSAVLVHLAPAQAADTAASQGSQAVTPEIVDAIAEEMERAMIHLRIDGAPGPYQISYKITEVEVNDVAATLGEVTSRRTRHFVNLEARVRVGSASLDNANFVVAGGEGIDGVAGINLPLEATPRIAGRAAWLVTDQAYKEAVIQLGEKLKRMQRSTARTSDVPSWTQEKPVVSEDSVAVPALESLPALEQRVRRISSAFAGVPHLRTSRTAMTSYLERRWYLNSEGTSVTDTRRASGVLVAASAQAPDGQDLAQYVARYGHTAADLPSDDDLRAEASRVVDRLAALQKAPIIDSYTGPVLFEKEGAVGVVRFSLAPHLGGTPLPEGLRPQEAKLFGGSLAGKLDQRVLAPSLSIVDDPTATRVAGQAIIGGYKIDDEGVPAARVEVISAGVLKNLLSSRTPAHKDDHSNGHARRTVSGGLFHGSATNLQLVSRGGLGRAALVQQLIAAAKAEGVPYGIIIKQFDDLAISAEPEYARRELFQMLQSTDPDLPPPSLLAYRVDARGKEELVRGVQPGEIPIAAWRDILAVGKNTTVFNFLASAENYLAPRIEGTDEGFVPSGGIESSVATPDLLFRRLEIIPSAPQRPLPLIPAPAAAP